MYHDNQWGTICDDSFGITDANVVCQMLNFTEGALCYVGYARFGRGQGIYKQPELIQCKSQVLGFCLAVYIYV